ncbi:MAG: LytR C-terminal domain-containing protein [Actinomycetota bacterium]|nr:LytR C-terminal domain-containing protein [Actinomycetota bacterium]
MGKHSDPSTFWRSVVIGMASTVGLVVLALLVAFAVWRLVINRDGSDRPTEAIPEDASLPGLDAGVVASPTATTGAGRVQVLNGSGSNSKAEAAREKLEQEGYEVVTTGMTSRPYPRTTIFYQPGAQVIADAIVSVYGLGTSQPAPPTLDTSIPVAVVVGADYPE